MLFRGQWRPILEILAVAAVLDLFEIYRVEGLVALNTARVLHRTPWAHKEVCLMCLCTQVMPNVKILHWIYTGLLWRKDVFYGYLHFILQINFKFGLRAQSKF